MINARMIELLFIFSVAVWALLSKTPAKALVKGLATMLFNRSYPRYPLRKRFLPSVSPDDFEQYVVKFCAALIALFLIGLAKTIDIAIIADNLSADWQWIRDAEFVSAAGVISLVVAKYSILYYVDILLTAVLIGVVGSAGIHRLEKWIGGNGLLFDVLRQWLLTSGQAGDQGAFSAAADKLYAHAEAIIKAKKTRDDIDHAKVELGFIADE